MPSQAGTKRNLLGRACRASRKNRLLRNGGRRPLGPWIEVNDDAADFAAGCRGVWPWPLRWDADAAARPAQERHGGGGGGARKRLASALAEPKQATQAFGAPHRGRGPEHSQIGADQSVLAGGCPPIPKAAVITPAAGVRGRSLCLVILHLLQFMAGGIGGTGCGSGCRTISPLQRDVSPWGSTGVAPELREPDDFC